jgi:hypothetical protein
MTKQRPAQAPTPSGREHKDKILDISLEQTFPASDPVQLTEPLSGIGAKLPARRKQEGRVRNARES